MTPQEFEKALDDLETRLERLRVLYEQWFQGLERLEPTVPRKDVDRRFDLMRREAPRTTGLRFRFQQLVMRYTTYTTYWLRVARQIEDGTYRRDVMKLRRKREEFRAQLKEELLSAMEGQPEEKKDEAYELDPNEPLMSMDEIEAALDSLEIARSLPPQPTAPRRSLSPFAKGPSVAPTGATEAASPKPEPKPVQTFRLPGSPPKPGLPRPPASAGAILSGAANPRATASDIRDTALDAKLPSALKTTEVGIRDTAVDTAHDRPTLTTSQTGARDTVRDAPNPLAAGAPRLAPPTPRVTNPGTASGGAPPGVRPPQPNPRATLTGTPAIGTTGVRPMPPAPGSQPKPVPMHPSGTTGVRPLPPVPPRATTQTRSAAAIDDASIRTLTDKLIATKRANNERIDNVRYETVAKQIRDMEPRLREKYGDRKIDFEVVIKDGRVGLKPVPK